MVFARFVRTPFLKNTTRQLLLIIAVSIMSVVKGELASETVNYDTKTMYKDHVPIGVTSVLIKKENPGETGFRSSRL